MSFDQTFEFSKDNLEFYLKEVAKEYRKAVGKKMPAELILVGGASVLINYGFRNMTRDVDAFMNAASSMKDAINRVADRYQLPNGWINADFSKTESFSEKIIEYSKYYKTFANVLTIRTIADEYLIAMKLKSFRQYKYDVSDIVGILKERKEAGHPITIEQIKEAVVNLYGKWTSISKEARQFIEKVIQEANYNEIFELTRLHEKEARTLAISIQNRKKVHNEEDLRTVLEYLMKKEIEDS